MIVSIGEILEEYDSDKRFPIKGFGAKLITGKTGSVEVYQIKDTWCYMCNLSVTAVQNCFNLDPNSEEVEGVGGILTVYRNWCV